MTINERQANLLSIIVQDFIESAVPVASRLLVEKFNLGVSPATVRNDMAVLEAVGFLRQPHTSSGRVPTEEGYRFYLENFVNQNCGSKVRAPLQRAALQPDSAKHLLKKIAKALVELSGETAISSLDAQWNHYAGISNLFGKPDFKNIEMMQSLSEVIDQFDEVLKKMNGNIGSDINVWIGGENPFGSQVATVMVQYSLPGGIKGLLGLVGPTRMNYQKNIRLIAEAKNLLDRQV